MFQKDKTMFPRRAFTRGHLPGQTAGAVQAPAQTAVILAIYGHRKRTMSPTVTPEVYNLSFQGKYGTTKENLRIQMQSSCLRFLALLFSQHPGPAPGSTWPARPALMLSGAAGG